MSFGEIIVILVVAILVLGPDKVTVVRKKGFKCVIILWKAMISA